MKNKGFTLVEMAVVLVIMSAVSGLLLSGLNVFMTHTRSATTHARQVAIKSALIAYLRDNKHLPCPATKADGAAGDCTSLSGTLPYRELSIPQDEALDAWGNHFTFVVTKDWTVADTFIKAPDKTKLVQLGDERAAVVLISHGDNGDGAINAQYQPNTAPAESKVEETANAEGCSPRCYREAIADGFDDRLAVFSPQELLEPLLQQGWTTKSDAACESFINSIILSSKAGPALGSVQLTIDKGALVVGSTEECVLLPVTPPKDCSAPMERVCLVLTKNGVFAK